VSRAGDAAAVRRRPRGGRHYNCAERNGKRLDVFCCIVIELENGRIIIGREHFYDLYAWDEFWS
jgi:hypothetical protein